MKATRRENTPCEIELRSALFRLGMRYRVHFPVPGTRRRADVAFPRMRIAVFVDGCFWHSCPDHATWPKANEAWWRRKLTANVMRDRDTSRRLEDAGWTVIRFWEHEDMEVAAKSVAKVVREKQRH
jgi:DNA mismatch endonuclease, patch repair protein